MLEKEVANEAVGGHAPASVIEKKCRFAHDYAVT
jgi:hypothetical protein